MDRSELSGSELPLENSEEATEAFQDSFGLKEVEAMLSEGKADIGMVIEIINHALLEPIPDPLDTAAAEEFDRKMDIIDRIAHRQLGRSAELRAIQERIDERREQASTDS